MIRVTKTINQKRYAKRVQQYIESCFNNYGIDYGRFFGIYDDEKDTEVLFPCYDSDWNLDMHKIAYAAKILGQSVDSILQCDDYAAEKWNKKYPFFDLLDEANSIYDSSFHDGPVEAISAEQLLQAIIGDKPWPANPRFDNEDIQKRLLGILDEMKPMFPDIYHENQEMVNLEITTATICHFEKTSEMLQSFFQMVDNARALFDKALREKLSVEEEQEYNFLSVVLFIKDINMTPMSSMFYDDIKRHSQIFYDEDVRSFDDAVNISHWRDFKPWRFAEFATNHDLAQRYNDLFPGSKQAMIEFSQKVANFQCFFWWEDSYKALEEFRNTYTIEDYMEDVNDEINMPEECEPIIINVPKTKEELGGEDAFIEQLKILCRSEKLGGLQNRPRTGRKPDVFKIMQRVGISRQNNYYDRPSDYTDAEVE